MRNGLQLDPFANNPEYHFTFKEYYISGDDTYASLNASVAEAITLDWAREILTQIRSEDRSERTTFCNDDGWKKYWKRVIDALHFTQDSVTVQHATGNERCGPSSAIPDFNGPGEQFKFSEFRECVDFNYGQFFLKRMGELPCDDELSNSVVEKMQLVCDFGYATGCMGLERTIRHHCAVASAQAHSNARGRHRTLQERLRWEVGVHDRSNRGQCLLLRGRGMPWSWWRWAGLPHRRHQRQQTVDDHHGRRVAKVCREPDVPCQPMQCDTWCDRSAGEFGWCEIVEGGSCVCNCSEAPFDTALKPTAAQCGTDSGTTDMAKVAPGAPRIRRMSSRIRRPRTVQASAIPIS